MGILSKLFGGGSAPKYDMNAAKDTFQWQQGQARYGVDNGLASLAWNPDTNTQSISYSPQMQGILDSLFAGGDASAKRAEESVFDNFNNRYQPIFERQTNQAMDRLKNQGIPVGSEAYNRTMQSLSQNQNDAALNAMNQAVLTGQAQANQSTQNNLGIFSAFNPLNGYQPGAGTPNIDLYGNAHNSAVNAYNTNNQNAMSNIMGIAGLGLGAAGLFSDARIKENLRAVGQLYNGLTVYAFNFPEEEITRIGLVAQEVEQVIPEAVTETSEGLLMVDYNAATRYAEESAEAQEVE